MKNEGCCDQSKNDSKNHDSVWIRIVFPVDQDLRFEALSLLSAALYADGAMALSYCDLSSDGSSSADNFCGGVCTVMVQCTIGFAA